jgi:hypothetical protein
LSGVVAEEQQALNRATDATCLDLRTREHNDGEVGTIGLRVKAISIRESNLHDALQALSAANAVEQLPSQSAIVNLAPYCNPELRA